MISTLWTGSGTVRAPRNEGRNARGTVVASAWSPAPWYSPPCSKNSSP